MTRTLAVYSATRRLGQITLDGNRLLGSTPALQNIADVTAQKVGGEVAKAYAALDGWTNGYLTIITDPATPATTARAAAAAFRPGEARDTRGRWAGGDAHGRFFHGTRDKHEPGQVLTGTVRYYTGYRPQAASYAQGAQENGPPRVYQVEPVEGHERDPEYPDTGEKTQWPPGGAWRAPKIRVIREVSHSETLQPEDTPAPA